MLFARPALFAQISPGPLSRAHLTLEGATKCAYCHSFGFGSKALKCLECHAEVRKRLDAGAGYHARVYDAKRGQLDCARCHSEHNGRQFQLTKFDKAKFAHEQATGFALAGKHQTLECKACHTATKITASWSADIKVKDRNHTYLGLGATCTSCHKDPHTGQLGVACQTCHSQDAWKPASGFDHGRTSYPLTGKHETVPCQKCHQPSEDAGARVAALKFRGLPMRGCQGCHQDPHRGAFQDAEFRGSCESCHVTAGWKALRQHSGFDHQRTKFPLQGKHAELTCFRCHKSTNFSQPIAHEKCGDCHEDIHGGQFSKRAAGDDCSACHGETSFKPALFTRGHHQKTSFPLRGKHFSIECAQCHKPAGRDAKYMLGAQTCVGCHEDPHGGEFRGEPHANQCEKCHTQDTFHPSTFDTTRHSKTKFTLAGAHAAVVCTDCHKPLQGFTAKAARRYHLEAQKCTECHADPHRTTQSCETCHNIRQWRELRNFDHNSTKFTLEGAHQTASCVDCHRPSAGAAKNKKPVPEFFHTPQDCSGCHEDIHGGQFASGGAEKECSHCHAITKWSAVGFDHGKTAFPLTGAHDKVRCGQCHTGQIEREGRTIRVYRGTPAKCRDCHGNTPVQ
ncbi:MAG: cytochrome c3 family protein [Bryobacteraceae bacterium]